jgi:hypothetical protein
MYFLFGLIFIGAAIASILVIGRASMALIAVATEACRRVLRWHRARRAKARHSLPMLRMPTPKPDWEALSRDMRQRLLERGPRASRETLLLSALDLEIAIELKQQELQRLKLETAALKAQSAKPRKGRKAAQSDLPETARQEPTTAWPAASAGDSARSPDGRFDESRDRPDWPAAGRKSVHPRVVRSDRYRH